MKSLVSPGVVGSHRVMVGVGEEFSSPGGKRYLVESNTFQSESAVKQEMKEYERKWWESRKEIMSLIVYSS